MHIGKRDRHQTGAIPLPADAEIELSHSLRSYRGNLGVCFLLIDECGL